MSDYKRLTDSEYAKRCKENGLTGYYIRLAELEDGIENGTLIKLPCRVGDTVYQTDGIRIYKSVIESIMLMYLAKRDVVIYSTKDSIAFDVRAIGESIFLTNAEAEQKLKEIKEGKQ